MFQAQSFIFDSFSFQKGEGKIVLRYRLDDVVNFEEVITLPTDREILHYPSDAALFLLHMAGGVSYYKTCLPKKIEVHSGTLIKEQAEFWNTVYEKGLGEFFYQNKIDYKGLIHFPVGENQRPTKDNEPRDGSRGKILVPIGGGKDSMVTIEKLREEGKQVVLFRMGAHPLISAIVKQTGLPCITVKRSLPATLFQMNAEGALNGHVPISAYLSALCVVIAEIYGLSGIAMSNEKSANYGNVEYLGTEINHQWSKSEEFEKMFQTYLQKNVNADLEYSSALRSMNELEIAKEFCGYPEYFPLCTSCNKNWKIAGELKGKRWCGNCPKCAFSFCLFSAYLPVEILTEMFGKNLFDDESLIPLYKELLGLEGVKPFECVGTPDEVKEAFSLAHTRGELEKTPIMKMFLASQT